MIKMSQSSSPSPSQPISTSPPTAQDRKYRAPLHRTRTSNKSLRQSFSIGASRRRSTMLAMYLWQLVIKTPRDTSQWLYVTLCRRMPWLANHLTLLVITSTLLIDQLCMMLVVPVLPLYMITHKQFQQQSSSPLNTSVFNVLTLHWMSIEEQCAFVIAVKGGVQVFSSMFLTAPLTRRLGYKNVLLMGLFGMTMSCEAFAYGSTLPLFIFARGIQGVSSSLVNAAGLSLLATQYRDEAKRDSAMGIAMCGMCIGYSAGPSAASILYGIGGKALPFHISAMMLVVIVTVICVITSNRAVGIADKRADTTLTSIPGKVMTDNSGDVYMQMHDVNNNSSSDMRKGDYDDERQLLDEDHMNMEEEICRRNSNPAPPLFRDPYILLCLSDIIISVLPVCVLEAVLTIHLSQNVPNTTDVTTGTVWLPSSVAMLTATYVTTLIMSKKPNAQPVIIQAALILECLSCICLPQSQSILGVSVWLAVLMFGDVQVETAVVPLISTIIDKRYGSDSHGHYGSGYALWDMVYSAVETVGPLVGGFMVVRIGFGPFMALVAILMLMAVPLNKRLHTLMHSTPPAHQRLSSSEHEQMTNGTVVMIAAGNTAHLS